MFYAAGEGSVAVLRILLAGGANVSAVLHSGPVSFMLLRADRLPRSHNAQSQRVFVHRCRYRVSGQRIHAPSLCVSHWPKGDSSTLN